MFDAVGFNFINRLIQTDTLPEGCEHNIYRSLALTLLACFSTDQNLVDHPQLCNKLPFFIRVISDGYATIYNCACGEGYGSSHAHRGGSYVLN